MADYTVGGRRLRARVLGGDLADQLGRALLPAGRGASPKMALDLWDVRETGHAAPSAPSSDETRERRGAFDECYALSSDRRYARSSGPQFMVRHGRRERRAVGWVSSASALSAWNRARPWQALIVSWLGELGSYVFHAAMVGRSGAGILLPGANGVGKSTTAAACVEAGFDFLGDDAVAVEFGSGGDLVGNCLHCVVKLDHADVRKFPSLAAQAAPYDPGSEEVVISLPATHLRSLRASSSIVALALPCLTDRDESRFTAIGGGRALLTLAGCALSTQPGRVAESFDMLSRAVDQTPAFRLEVGRDARQIARALDGLLKHVSA